MIALCASKAGVWVQSLVREEPDQVLLHAAQSIHPKLKKENTNVFHIAEPNGQFPIIYVFDIIKSIG